MPAVAEVQFKASGSQQVVTAFNSVGSAAQTSSTKIQQNSTAVSSLGKGMKSSVAGIGQVTTAFATLSLSIVSTWRAYRDLTDAQIAVDKANLRVKKTQEAIKKTTAEIAALQKGAAKGGLEDQRRKINLTKLTLALTAAEKKYGKGSIEAADARLKLKEAEAAGAGSSEKLQAAQAKLGIQQEQLGVQTDVAKEAQERYNDTQQNFYLSIIPSVIAGIATLTSAFSGFKGMLSGGGGLLAGLGPIGLILGGITLAIIAFKTNFLGLRDAIGGVIQWLKDRFGVWKDTIEKVFNLIRTGNWGAAFDMIKLAAIKFWIDLKKSVPFFGFIEGVILDIANGKWGDAFDKIKEAAVKFWEDLKVAVPILADVEAVIKAISEAKWGEAFAKAGEAAKNALASIFGKDAVSTIQDKITTMTDTAKNLLNQFAFDMNKPGGAISQINAGFAKLGQGDIAGGFAGIATGIQTAINLASNAINNWVLQNFGVNLAGLEGAAMAIGNKILDGIKAGLTFVARTWIDPILVALLDPQTWITGFIAMGGFFVKIGTALYTAIGTALGNAAKDPKGAATWWGDIGNAIWTGLSTWFTANLPGAKKAMEAIAKSLSDGVEAAKIQIQNVGIAIWNQIIEGIRTFTGGAASPFGGALDALKKTPIELPVKPVVTPEGKTAIETWVKNADPLKFPTEPDETVMKKNLNTQLGKVFKRGAYVVPKIDVGADTKEADQKAKAQVKAINNMKATIKVSIQQQNITNRFAKMARLTQHGYQGTVKRPTTFIAGEGGRHEDVRITPRGSVQRGGSGGGGSTHITISFEPQEFAQFIRYRINDNQGVVK